MRLFKVPTLYVALVATASGAAASETITYSYQSTGGLASARSTGSVNNGQVRQYCRDKAGNRTKVIANSSASEVDCGTPPPPPPSFSVVNAPPVTEGGKLHFVINKSHVNTVALTLGYATSNGTAIAGSDYTAASGTISFAPNELSKSIYVQTIDDTVHEPSEIVYLAILNPSGGASITESNAMGVINDNDPANLPPVARPDSLTVKKCLIGTVNVLANDYDPDGNTPLTLVSASASSNGPGEVRSITGGSISYQAFNREGADIITYTIRDSLGATATGTVSVSVTSSTLACSM